MDDSHAFIEPKLEVKTEDGIDRTGILINSNYIINIMKKKFLSH